MHTGAAMDSIVQSGSMTHKVDSHTKKYHQRYHFHHHRYQTPSTVPPPPSTVPLFNHQRYHFYHQRYHFTINGTKSNHQRYHFHHHRYHIKSKMPLYLKGVSPSQALRRVRHPAAHYRRVTSESTGERCLLKIKNTRSKR